MSKLRILLCDSSFLFTSLLQHDRLKKFNAELEEKLEAAEIQIKGQSTEYRSTMQQKDVCLGIYEAENGRKMNRIMLKGRFNFCTSQ